MEDTQKQTEQLPLADTANADGKDKERPAFCNKFSSAEELEKAYDNLQREFTKKCQANSALVRELETARSGERKEDEGEREPQTSRPEGQHTDLPTAENGDGAPTPFYESEDWDGRVSGFMQKYPSAARHAHEIAKELAKDRELATQSDCLEQAYFRVLRAADRPYEELAADDGFLEKYVYASERVRERIIEDYLREKIEMRVPPTIAASGRTHLTPPSRPKSIREAGGIVKNMLENRRI